MKAGCYSTDWKIKFKAANLTKASEEEVDEGVKTHGGEIRREQSDMRTNVVLMWSIDGNSEAGVRVAMIFFFIILSEACAFIRCLSRIVKKESCLERTAGNVFTTTL